MTITATAYRILWANLSERFFVSSMKSTNKRSSQCSMNKIRGKKNHNASSTSDFHYYIRMKYNVEAIIIAQSIKFFVVVVCLYNYVLEPNLYVGPVLCAVSSS